MNILILSAGTRNKIVQYFKKELEGRGKVVAADMSALAPALYEADNFYIVPRMTEEGYIAKILYICQKEKINAVFSLIDPELSLLAKNHLSFEKIGVKVVIPMVILMILTVLTGIGIPNLNLYISNPV